MAVEQIDPGTLEGDALRRWYLRSPADIEKERQDADAQRYHDFFGDGGEGESDPTFDTGPHEADEGVRTEGAEPEQLTEDAGPSFTWVAAGPNRFQRIPASQGGSAPSSYQPIAKPASPLIHVAAHPRQPISVGGSPQHPSSHPTYANNGGQSQIAYGALRAPAPSDQELAELRRQQAAFGNTTRQIDIHNSWFAAPALAPPLAALGLGALGEWASGEVAPEAGQAVANFIEKDPYLRVGDNWATRAGRRAHAALKDRLAKKPGWEYEPRIQESGDPPLKPDVGAPQRKPLDPRSRRLMELKPDTPTGRAAAARAVKRYFNATGRKVRPIFYKLEDFI